MDRLEQLRRRRERLVLAAAAQRATLAREFRPLEAPFAIADRGIDAVRYLRAHPGFVIAGVALLVVLRPRRVLAWTSRGLAAWRSYQLVASGYRRLFH